MKMMCSMLQTEKGADRIRCSHDPPELARLVVGSLPGSSEQNVVVCFGAASENELGRVGIASHKRRKSPAS